MMHSEQIKKIIAEGLPCELLNVEGDGDHFEAVIVSAEFIGKSRCQECGVADTLRQPAFRRASAYNQLAASQRCIDHVAPDRADGRRGDDGWERWPDSE